MTGTVASAATAAFPVEAQAFFPALMTSISRLVTLWNGAKMVKEVYDALFGEKQKDIEREVTRHYTNNIFIVQNYYQFNNPYKIPGLGGLEPGCQAILSSQQPATISLCCGNLGAPVLLQSGFVVALQAAVDELRSGRSDEDVFAYTRPLKYLVRTEPWQGPFGVHYKSDVAYSAAWGSVALRWLIVDGTRRIARGEYIVRDDRSNRTIAAGQTASYYF
jgi:hypothetical protein